MSARHPEFAPASQDIRESVDRENCGAIARPLPQEQFSGTYSLNEYITIALAQHPKVQASRWAVDAAAWQIPVASSLEDPRLSITALPAPIQTAAGRQNVQVGFSQKLPIRKKQERKQSIAWAATEEARAYLAAAERAVAADVREVYADMLFRQEALEILADERELLAEVTEIVVALYKTDKVSQQDIAQAELAQLQVEQEFIAAREQLRSSQIAMARLLHTASETDLRARDEPCLERLSTDVNTLVDNAIANRPELHALIAQANQDRMTACLAKLDYIPDPTIGATWSGISPGGISPVANGNDALMLNVSMNLPIYGKRIEGKIKSAEAKAMSSTRMYDDLRDETSRGVFDVYSRLGSKLELIDLLRAEVIPKADETLRVAVKAYSVSEVDIQQVLETWRKLIRLEMSMRELERDYRKSLAALERVVGSGLMTTLDCEVSRLPTLGGNTSGSEDADSVDDKETGDDDEKINREDDAAGSGEAPERQRTPKANDALRDLPLKPLIADPPGAMVPLMRMPVLGVREFPLQPSGILEAEAEKMQIEAASMFDIRYPNLHDRISR